ncbi:MAG: nitrite/sulfite reductase [Bacteroidota bacterium]
MNFSPNIATEDQKDILELERRIKGYNTGKEDEERFKLYRLTRGVYGQRQLGVQMFRIKIPYGRLTTEQLVRIADVSEKYATGNLHITTRQDIQLHYVKLGDSPKVWEELAEKKVTAREACGNTVRNITGSAKAGIDPNELFDISPYVHATYEYFLRNPICQEMGRKIKIAFSSSDVDSAYTYFHDFGFIPRLNEKGERGFKVVIGGGLGAVGAVAQTAYEFLHEDQIIPFMEAGIRVFDRYGEREKRMKARMKFLVKALGFEGFMDLVHEEWKAIKNKTFKIDTTAFNFEEIPAYNEAPKVEPYDAKKYELWLQSNVFEQKQKGFYGVQLRVELGDFKAPVARKLAALVSEYAADDIRMTVNQGILLKFVRKENLPFLFNELAKLNLANPGFNTIADITACPGTDTCALGVTNSTGLAQKLEATIQEEYPHLLTETNIKIKISGCMNACGQHTAANIGFHGSSIKKRPLVIPAMQVVIGGGVSLDGKGYIAEKVIKVPTKKVPDVLRILLNDYEENGLEGEYFNDFYYRLGKRYFYDLLKPLAAIESLEGSDFFDWGQDHEYRQEIGVGECAGVMLDVIGTIIQDASDKITFAKEALAEGIFADAIYHAYSAFVVGAKALLLSEDVKCNTHKKILSDFQTHFIETGNFALVSNFPEHVLRINKNEPSEAFAKQYIAETATFIQKVIATRTAQLESANGVDKEVVADYYKA